MADILKGRMTADLDREVVVFLIGMRINHFWNVNHWWPVATAMPRMIRELSANPELGFLHAESWFGRTTIMLQYWQSFDHLEAYAKSGDHAHLPAWAAFNRNVAGNGSVGIWHETYRVKPGNFEAIYTNMPPFGMAKATRLVEAAGDRATARARLSRS